jgi:hypothetical protein
MKTAIAAALLVCTAGVARADVLYSDAITFGPSYAIVPSAGFPWVFAPEYGAPLSVVGVVTAVAAPFGDLLPSPPYEITFAVSGAACDGYGMWDDFTCNRGGTDYSFTGGSISIFLDTTPDADFATPSTLQDGELVLLAQTQGIHITNDDPDGFCVTENYPDVHMFFSFVGGSWYYRVTPGAVSFATGEIPGDYPDMIPEALRALGYVLRIDGGMDIFGPVRTEPVTWGRVKSMYR